MLLLAADTLKSDDPDLEAAASPAASPNPNLQTAAAAAAAASPNPNLQTAAHPAAAANIAMHPITGTFADPAHESAFAAQLFRMAYPTHVLLMALDLAFFTWSALVQPDMRSYWAVVLCAAVGLACRVLLHRTGTHDPVRSQWMGSWAWTILTALIFAVDMVSFMVAPAAACLSVLQDKYMGPFVFLLYVLINGTHGLGFACKFTLMTIFLTNCIVGIVTCHDPELDPWFICTMGAIVLGSATTHTGELYLRRSYSEKVQAKMQDEKSQARNEQLQAEKERLLYDVQRRGRPLDDDDERSAIRRGLLAGPSHPCPPTIDTDPSEAGAPAPSDSPPTLPPGPPSSVSSGSVASYGQKLVQKVQTRSLLPSLTPGAPPGTAGGSSTAPPLTWAEADRQWLVAQGATHVEGLVLAGSSQNSTGFEGVYASGGGFGAELPQGAKRLRQDGFRSPAEAALARARWTKSLEEGKSLEEAGASSEQQEQEVVPARWAVLGGIESPMRFANRPGGPAQSSRSDVVPLSWVEADRQWHAENPGWARSVVADSAAGAATLLTPTAPAAESICNEELMEKVLAEMGTDGDGTAAASTITLGYTKAMEQLQRAIWLADRPAQELWLARCSFASSSQSQPSQEVDTGLNNVAAPPSHGPFTLKQKFDALVMCDFTPRHPNDLPTSQWVSYASLLQLFQPHAPMDVWRTGPGNLKQLITEWYKGDPTFIGLAPDAWCKRVPSNEPQDQHAGSGKKHVLYRFCFEYTPRHFPGL